MYIRLGAVLACVTMVFMIEHCNGMPTTRDVETSPYSFYYKVFDSDSNNYQGHVERKDDNGVTSGTYYHLAPDGIWYQTTYSNDGDGLKSELEKFDSPEDLSVNVFGPEDNIRSDEGQIVIADGAGVIGGTMYGSDEPEINIRTGGRPEITEEDIRNTIFGGNDEHRPIVFGSSIGDENVSSGGSMRLPSIPETGREIVFGGSSGNDLPTEDIGDLVPAQPLLPIETGPPFNSGFLPFDSLGSTPLIGDSNLDGNVIQESPASNINDFDAGFDQLFG